MSLKRRFFIRNALMVLFTILFTALGVVVFIATYTLIYGSQNELSGFNRIFEVKAGFNEIKRKALSSKPEEVFSGSFQNALAIASKAFNADAVILRGREVRFSTKKFSSMDIEKCLEITRGSNFNGTIELGGNTYLLDRVDLSFMDDSTGAMLLIAPLNLKVHFYRILLLFTFMIFLLSFMGVNLWVSIAFSKGVINPVSRLKTAAARISEGDLSGEIIEEGEGEVRELCRALELMRLKFKESVYLQEKYDENRKFLVSSISHDLKTPVTSIKGYIEGILDGVAKTPEKEKKYLETARSKAILVNSMIDDLLLYSKLDLNQIPFHFEKTDLLKYFEYSVSENQLEFKNAHVTLSLENSLKGQVSVTIDRERFKRVIQNVFDNAKKFISRADGEVTVILRETHTSVIIEIRDNGRGIPVNEVPYVFERFYRADASRNSTGGSGLGLAIAKQIVEGHEGRIWVVSSEGKGTRVIISLKRN